MLTRQQLIEFLGQRSRCIHFVGICGNGMSGLAKLLLEQGHIVSGCDQTPNGESAELRRLGARVRAGHCPSHLGPEVELVVHTSAVNGDNAELQAARSRVIPVVPRGRLLSAVMNHSYNIAVAGSHGKTTTTAMIAHVLAGADSPPSFCVGAPVPVLGGNARLGGGKYFVAEADESDGTLIGFTPEYAVCLNIEAEHLDHYGSVARLRATFQSFLSSALRRVFYCADCPACRELAPGLRAVVSFGLSPTADYRALRVEPTSRGSRFVVACRNQEIATIELNIPGVQNVVNALAVIAVAEEVGVPMEKIRAALAGFTGARRRFERKFEGRDLVVVEDYAHHPTEVRATIAAARSLGFRRILVAFQPHRYTRTRALCAEFGSAFDGVDKLWLADVYAASEAPIPGVSGRSIFTAVTAAGRPAGPGGVPPGDVVYEPDLEALGRGLLREAAPGDLLLVMGAGDIYQVADRLANELAGRGPHLAVGQSPASIAADLQALLSEQSQVRRREPMATHTSLQVGGPAEVWVEPWGEQDLAELLRYCHGRGIPVMVVGRGTNLLVRDGGIAGVVVHLGSPEFSKVAVAGERLMARAGARLRELVNLARRESLGGLEFLEGIPGSVGGALRMNAGAMGRQTFEVVERVRYVSLAGELYDREARTLSVQYRSCPALAENVALEAVFRGHQAERTAIEETLRSFAKRRWASQPAKPSAGCVFKNPATIAAGKLIEELGLKGMAVGGARVSERHGNFIVNEGGATAAEILELIGVIRERARRERGIELESEVMVVGND